MAGKEASAQEGFNVGFRETVYVGYNWSLVRGITSSLASLPDGLKETMVDTKEIQNKFQHLHESLQSLSTTEMLKVFHDYLSKKYLKRVVKMTTLAPVSRISMTSDPMTVFTENYTERATISY